MAFPPQLPKQSGASIPQQPISFNPRPPHIPHSSNTLPKQSQKPSGML